MKTIYSVFISLFIFIFACAQVQAAPKAKHAAESPYVNVTTVNMVPWVSQFSEIGTVKAVQGTDLSAQVAGIVGRVHFTSGQLVQKGAVLLTLKNAELKATVEQDQQKHEFAKGQLHRFQQAYNHGGAISIADLEQKKSDLKEAQAQLDHDQAMLNQTIIKAPFSGQLGVSRVSVGQYLTAGQKIVAIEDLDKLYVDFNVPEKISDMVQVGRSIKASSKQTEQHHWSGKVVAIGSAMDEDTRSLPVRAALVKPYNYLTPGMYVRVAIMLPGDKDRLVIPQSSIMYNPFGDSVYVVKDKKAMERSVTLGARMGENVAVVKGLKVGEHIVSAGQQKLFSGQAVNVETS